MVVVCLGAALFITAGRIVASEDPLVHADAIFVLGGSWVDRWLEAEELWREGVAPHIVLSRGLPEPGAAVLAARGVHVPDDADIARDVMTRQMGLPADVVEILAPDADNTAQEAHEIRNRARQAGWRRLIVITARTSTRRAGYAMRRELGSNVEVIMRAPRTDTFAPWKWWRTRGDFRGTFYDLPKLFAYWCGLKG